jgi:hypothetical protein
MKLSCPQCGADIPLQPRSLQLICPFCNTPIILSKEPSLEHYRMEPTIEEAPAIALAQEVLRTQNRTEEIETKIMYYLPFYRFLSDKNGVYTEQVYSALTDSPFPLFSIPSGTLTPLSEKEPPRGPQPQRQVSEILKGAKLEKTKSIEEMLLLFLPFWKVTLATGEIIWIDAVQGKVVASSAKKRAHHMPGILTRTLFSVLLLLLFVEGIVNAPLPIRLVLQMVTAGIALFIAKRVVNHAS